MIRPSLFETGHQPQRPELDALHLLNADDLPVELDPALERSGGPISIVPMQLEHAALLQPYVTSDREAFELMLSSPLAFDDDAERWMRWLLDRVGVDSTIAFTVLDVRTGRFLGYTRFLHIDRPNRAIHIGGTYYVPDARGTNVNPTCKGLLLEYLFEVAGINRVTIQADLRNARSCRSIEKLGATYEGVARAQYIGQDGAPRDTAIYSILRSEWHLVRPRLERLAAASAPVPRAPGQESVGSEP